MTTMIRTTRTLALAGLLALAAVPSFAAETVIAVSETGEGGGAMGVKLEPASVKAGPVVFQVKNDAMAENHEMIVVKLAKEDDMLMVDPAKHRVDEKKLKSLGEVSNLKPGASGKLKVTLTPGTYMVFCNIKGHYEAGMATKLTVTP